MVDVYDRRGYILDHHSYGGIEVIGLKNTGVEEYSKFTEPNCIEEMLRCIDNAIITNIPQIMFYKIRSKGGLWLFRKAHILSNCDGETVTAFICDSDVHGSVIIDPDGAVKKVWSYPGLKKHPGLLGLKPHKSKKVKPQLSRDAIEKNLKDRLPGSVEYTIELDGTEHHRRLILEPNTATGEFKADVFQLNPTV